MTHPTHTAAYIAEMLQSIRARNIDPIALCIWREGRGDGDAAMTAIACVIQNRAKKHGTTLLDTVMFPYAFSSMTVPGDIQCKMFPEIGDVQYVLCSNLAEAITTAQLTFDTGDATLYYDDSITFPKTWDPAHVQATIKIRTLNFFREI